MSKPDPLIWPWPGTHHEWRDGAGPFTSGRSHACNCIGPQGGKPLCPCRMRNVEVRDGRFVEIIDHGPVHPVSIDVRARNPNDWEDEDV